MFLNFSKQLTPNTSEKNNGNSYCHICSKVIQAFIIAFTGEVESYPLALRGTADDRHSENELPTMGDDGGERNGKSAGNTFKPATEKEKEETGANSSKAKKGPYYTEVVKVRKSPKDGAERYNKLKRSSEPALCFLEPSTTPLSPGPEGYSPLVTGNLTSPPLPPTPSTGSRAPRDALQASAGQGEGGAGETVYYNEMPIPQKSIYGDEPPTEECGAVVQYANC